MGDVDVLKVSEKGTPQWDYGHVFSPIISDSFLYNMFIIKNF